MQVTSSRMINKEKYLGQFFSGEKIAKLLFELLDTSSIQTVIDPMCGIGDMFEPFHGGPYQIHANEIDGTAYNSCKQRFPNITITNLNCFSSHALNSYSAIGYDLVITNPPYIRYQLRDKVQSIIDNEWMELKDIKKQLKSYCDIVITDYYENQLFKSCIENISGLADLAVPCWILCLMLLKPGGQLAIVMPNAWLTREYSMPVKRLLAEILELNYVINDANSAWFTGKAQVKTTLLIGKRCKPKQSHLISLVDLYKSAISETSLIGKIPENDPKNAFKENFLIENLYKCSLTSQADYLNTASCLSAIQLTVPTSIEWKSLESYGIKIGQGLRSGANIFFYPETLIQDENCSKYLIEAIQKQTDLKGYLTAKGNSHLIYIQDALTPEDFASTYPQHQKHFSILPKTLCEYIAKYSQIKKGENIIPELSSVKTNVTTQNEIRPPRFWYMLPKLTERHLAPLFIPRVNGGYPIVRYNPNRLVIDANFCTIWLEEKSELTILALLAILNSSWCVLQYEELGTVLGGGALKVDAAQLKKVILPNLKISDIKKLHGYGSKLAYSPSHNEETIKNIDEIIIQSAGVSDADISTHYETIKQRLNYLLTQRQHGSKRN